MIIVNCFVNGEFFLPALIQENYLDSIYFHTSKEIYWSALLYMFYIFRLHDLLLKLQEVTEGECCDQQLFISVSSVPALALLIIWHWTD